MSFKSEYHTEWNVTQKICHSNLNITKFEMLLKLKFESNCNVTQNGISLKMEQNSKCHVTQTKMSLKINATQI